MLEVVVVLFAVIGFINVVLVLVLWLSWMRGQRHARSRRIALAKAAAKQRHLAMRHRLPVVCMQCEQRVSDPIQHLLKAHGGAQPPR